MTVNQIPFIHLDLGNFASTDEGVADFKTRFLWSEMEAMGVTATTPGSRELNLWSTYKDFVAAGTVPVVCSNLSLSEAGVLKPVGMPYKVVNVNGLRVALMALIGGDEFSAARPPEGVEFKFDDPFQRAAELVPELHKQADVVVLLSELSTADTDRLITTVPGIDVAVYGNRATWVEEAVKNGETITNQTGTRGQYLGELVLIVDPEGKVIEFGSMNGALDKVYPEDDGCAARVKEADDQAKKIQTEAREKRQTEFENKVTGERFLGSDTCKRCHEKQYQQWSTTPHAHAFASLETSGEHEKAECVKCHVTGHGESSGFVSASASPGMKNVQCEACHARGTEHDRSRQTSVAESQCKACHQGEWGKNFDFAALLPKVQH